jgi:hypothetical protein
METLGTIEESLPSLVLALPEDLITNAPTGDKEATRSLYRELQAMGQSIDLARLRGIKAELASMEVEFTWHDSEIGNIQDWWFGTKRVRGDTYSIVLYGLVSAYINAIEDLSTQSHTLSSGQIMIIEAGLPQIAGVSYEFLYGEQAVPQLSGALMETPGQETASEPPPAITQPMQRWRAGHQLFFVSIQTLNMLFSMIARSVEKEDWTQSNDYLRKAAFFMNMSARSIEYASNYDSIQYEKQIRPVMPPGFSGLMLADHTLLINLLKDLRATIFSFPPRPVKESTAVFLAAMAECYDAHNVICEAFVNKGPSLRDMNNPKSDSQPAIEMLDKLKNKRQKMLSAKREI